VIYHNNNNSAIAIVYNSTQTRYNVQWYKQGTMYDHGHRNHTVPRYHAFTAVSQATLAALAPNS